MRGLSEDKCAMQSIYYVSSLRGMQAHEAHVYHNMCISYNGKCEILEKISMYFKMNYKPQEHSLEMHVLSLRAGHCILACVFLGCCKHYVPETELVNN